MKKILFGWFVFVCVLLFAESAFACSCVGPPRGTPLEKEIADNYARTLAVFVGEVVSVKHNVNHIRERDGLELIGLGTIDVTFKVTRALKGGMKVNDLLVVRTVDQGSSCGFDEWAYEKPGTAWVIYADQAKGPRPKGDTFLGELIPEGAETILVTIHCSRTAPVTSAAADLKYFDSLKK